MKSFFRTDAQPSIAATWVLSIFFFLLLIAAYLAGSYFRHLENPQDKVMPTFFEMLDGLKRSAFEPDRNGDLRLWIDTFASARRFGIAIGVIFLAIPLGDMITFAVLVAAAVVLRRQTDAHKRLMLLATISLLTAAIARGLAQVNAGGPMGLFLGTDIFVLALILYDYASRGQVHTASMWGGLLIVVLKPLLFAASGTSAWLAFADTLR